MRRRSLIISGLILLACVQIAVAVSVIYQYEITLKKGTAYRFKTAPVDPYDAFRGRYVRLSVDRSVPKPSDAAFYRGQDVYVTISEGSDGYAGFTGIATTAPPSGDYLKTTVAYSPSRSRKVLIDIPFKRYYMNEDLAPAAERAYARHSRRDKKNAWVVVRVRNGRAVIEGLYVAGRPISEYARMEVQKNKRD